MKPSASSGARETFIALLRGINVGGKNKVPMRELARLFEAAGCSDVSTYIQSGNVVLTTTAKRAATLPVVIARDIAARFGCTVPVILRTASELHDVARANPFVRRGESHDALHVMFLADVPEAGAVAALDPKRSPGDEFVVRGRDIYLFCPKGVADTKLTNAYFDARLATKSTGRNWRTVEKLVVLTTR